MILFGLGLILVAAIGIVITLVVALFGYAYLTKDQAKTQQVRIDPTF